MNLRKIIKFFLFSKWKFLYKENYFLLFDGEGKAKIVKYFISQGFFCFIY